MIHSATAIRERVLEVVRVDRGAVRDDEDVVRRGHGHDAPRRLGPPHHVTSGWIMSTERSRSNRLNP